MQSRRSRFPPASPSPENSNKVCYFWMQSGSECFPSFIIHGTKASLALSNPSWCWSVVFYMIVLLAGVVHFITMLSADKARDQGNFKKIRNNLKTCCTSPLLVESLATFASIRKVQTLIAFPVPCEKTLAETSQRRMEAFVIRVHLMYLRSHSCETEMYPSPMTRGLALKTGLKE